MRYISTLILLAGLALHASTTSADEDPVATALDALQAFINAVIQGPDAVAPLLAPEFQIMRANAVGYDRESYLERGAGSVKLKPGYSFEDVHVTMHEDIMVVRSMLKVEESIDGNPVKRLAPRLTVFRKVDDIWKVVSHANFGATH